MPAEVAAVIVSSTQGPRLGLLLGPNCRPRLARIACGGRLFRLLTPMDDDRERTRDRSRDRYDDHRSRHGKPTYK